MADGKTGAEGVTALAEADAPVFETLIQMNLDTFERSGLDQEAYLLARIAALVAMDASAPSYLLNIGTAAELGVPLEKIQGTLVAIAPVVGSARVVSAARSIGEAFGLELNAEDA
ncbi:carboxymuconolactone decarboxylase family protein [Streptomyces massasporeus]|uniref:carboxymuconolactone decarboxylase family protein n=1 Tax=Streptomyces TaxID=1883 RepID=UPI00160D0583|nr:carboxymuconolactone decarboxylase family protein [Streptomyces sp. AK010]MBB6419267.1 alkylhydroperoxidase/carboxymuconolactone decarboxylase family protein YurZ [Streptomyces sp. AK010]